MLVDAVVTLHRRKFIVANSFVEVPVLCQRKNWYNRVVCVEIVLLYAFDIVVFVPVEYNG